MSAAVASGKATVEAAANIAFIKYWGMRDPQRVLPANPSISMTLTACVSRCTAELLPPGATDEVWWAPARGGALIPAEESFGAGVRRHLEAIRRWAGADRAFRIAARNSFPAAAGLASSASGFAALALAAARALGREVTPTEHSALARLSGSGSAARSAFGGYVEWPGGGADGASAFAIAPASHWDLADVIAVVDLGAKEVSSREGHRRAPSSRYFAERQRLLPARLTALRQALAERRLDRLGPLLEEEAVDLHLIAMSSRPPIFYWRPATLEVLTAVRGLRDEGAEAWATIDAGPNVHVICPGPAAGEVAARLAAVPGVERVILDGVGEGPRVLAEHLF